MKGIDRNEVCKFYNDITDIWPSDERWFVYTNKQIEKYLNTYRLPDTSYILNAGSAGNTYGLPYKFHHVDIAEKHLEGLEHATVASVESLPFDNEAFDGCICVGSVINYCDALVAIAEMLRVIKPGGVIVLEFENSNSYEYKHSDVYGKAAGIVTVNYRQQEHHQWLYSYRHIKNICESCGAKIRSARYFHILSSLKLARGLEEDAASEYAKYDKLLACVPLVKAHAGNIIVQCTKL